MKNERINNLAIVYTKNKTLYVNKTFKDQAESV